MFFPDKNAKNAKQPPLTKLNPLPLELPSSDLLQGWISVETKRNRHFDSDNGLARRSPIKARPTGKRPHKPAILKHASQRKCLQKEQKRYQTLPMTFNKDVEGR